MTYSLHTLTHPTARAEEEAPPPTFWARFAQEIVLLMGGAALVLCLLALLSYPSADPAWSTSGNRQVVHNWIGRAGALLADLAYFGLGYSAWWCLAAGARAWLVGLARWMRGTRSDDTTDAAVSSRGGPWSFWLGLLLLLAASTSIEWARLYRLEANLPGHSGGALGYVIGSLAVHWLGFTGAALALSLIHI
jgi:S-DNA-T family DNA segregation ATPase FtsK/SpoIIIE